MKKYKQSIGILISGCVFTLIGFVLLYVLVLGLSIDNKAEEISVASMMTFFSLIGIFIITSYLNYSIIVSKEKLTIVNHLGKKTEVLWETIENISISKIQHFLVIKTKDKVYKIRYPDFDYKSMIKELINYLNPETISDELHIGEIPKISNKKWIISGLYFGITMVIFMELLFPLIEGKEITQKNLLIGIPLWLLAGGLWALTMRYFTNVKRKSS